MEEELAELTARIGAEDGRRYVDDLLAKGGEAAVAAELRSASPSWNREGEAIRGAAQFPMLAAGVAPYETAFKEAARQRAQEIVADR
jgi:hypothetical protein